MAADGPSTATPGSLIALEGLADDALDTQLHLLPTSSQILVLPSLQHYLDQDSDADSDDDNALQQGPHSAAVSAVQPYSTPYDVRRYIRRVHAAANTRRDIALEFLRGGDDQKSPLNSSAKSKSKSKSKSRSRSTSRPRSAPSKRFVFLNGGTASGHALCIEAIRQRHTAANGNVDKAARLFNDLTSDGIAGLRGAPCINLRKATPSHIPDAVPAAASSNSNSNSNGNNNGISCANCNLDPTDDSDDPITKAMRAADALDRETETLQPNTNTIDLTTDGCTARRMRPRSMSLPVHGELLDLMEFSRRISHASKASASANSAISATMTASTATHDRASSIWVRPSVAAGASGSEVYDISNFNFMSPSFAHAMGTPSIPPANSNMHSHSQTRFSITTQTSGTTHSPTRSPTSTIFPISMRLDAIAAQSQRATSVYFGQPPAPRGRSRFRPRNLASEPSTQSLEDLVFPMPPRRAHSLERSGSQSSHSFASNFLLSNSRDTSLQRLSYLSDMTQSTTSVVVAGPGATSGPAIPLRKSSMSYYETASSPAFPMHSQGKTPVAPAHPDSAAKLPKASPYKSIPNRKWPMYVDRGTDTKLASDAVSFRLQSPLPGDDEVFEPVLPFTEDLVIYFDKDKGSSGGDANPALELAFERCRELYCSRVRRQRRNQKQQQLFKVKSDEELNQLGLKSHLELDRQTIASSLPETPRSASHGHGHGLDHARASSVSTTASSSIDDYDPFAPHEYDASPQSRPYAPSLSSVKTAKPPTPAHTPPPPREDDGSDSEDDNGHTQTSPHFCTIDSGKRQSPLALQNALRSILALHFSRSAAAAPDSDDEIDLSASPGRVLMSYLTGMESAELWSPLLDGVDLVLAIGGQRGVQPELISKITSQFDQALGSPDGAARCDRLDVRYLMANAMQSLKKTDQKVEPKTLATFVLKQLDLYLKTSPAGSFSAFASLPPPRTVLLDYPLELLAIVLGLRQLAGRDVVQVASVVAAASNGLGGDDEIKVRPGFQKLRASPPPSLRPVPSSHSISSLNSFRSAATSASSSTFKQDPEQQKRQPYMRANYLLTSAATSYDIAAFVAAVRKMPAPPSPSPVQPREAETAGRYSALSTATTAAGMSMSTSMGMQMQLGMNRSVSRNSNMSPMHSPGPIPPPPPPMPMPMSPVSARKPVPSHTRAASSTTTIRHAPQVQSQFQTATTRSKSPAPSVKSEMSHVSQASRSSSIVSQPDSWRSTTGSNYKNAATGLAPAPVVLPSSRLVAKTIQVGRRREEPVSQSWTQAKTQTQSQAQAEAQRQPSPQPSIRQPLRQPSPQPTTRRQSPQPLLQPRSQSQAQDRGRDTPDIQYNDDDYDFDDLDDDDLDNDMDMRRLMPLYMRDRTVLLKAKEAAGLRNMRVPSACSKSGRLTGMSNYSNISNSGSGAILRRSVVEHQSQSQSQSQAQAQALNQSQSQSQSQHQLDLERGRLQPRGSMNSMRSQVSHASLGQNNEGKKALKWLGLA